MKYTLEIDSINKSYNENIILSDIYLKCETNDIVGIFGRNGSGKSTLLKIIYGTLKAENKFIKLNNKVEEFPYKVENGISYLPQENFIPEYFTVRKAINLSIENSKLSQFYNDELISKVIDNKIATLSGGELKYLHLKIVLFNDSKFCLLDEPYNGISPIMIIEINKIIVEQSKRKGIIITDHNYNNLLEIVTKIYLIKNRTGYLLKDKNELIKHGYLNAGMLE
ncbi:MAG: ATP-binding cassette domain-containing protein [Flavobacterium sp.]|uniref:ATP-binding cassette domain-containing protein n=1 Tax=Flavobacterium sp. TaxID=239 RepID=UPI0032651FAC